MNQVKFNSYNISSNPVQTGKKRSYVNKKTLLSVSAGIGTTGYMLLNKGQESNIFKEAGRFFRALGDGARKNIPVSFADGFKLLQIGEIQAALKTQVHPALSPDFSRAINALNALKKSPGKKHLAELISKGTNMPTNVVKQQLKYEHTFIPLFSKYLKSLSLSDSMKSSTMLDALEKRAKNLNRFATGKAIAVGAIITLVAYDILSLIYKTLNRINTND